MLSPFDLIVASALFVAAVILVLRTFDYFILSPKPLTVAVLFGAVAVTGALSFYAGWSGEHVEYAHIDVATLADGAGSSGGGGEGQCVDVSMLPGMRVGSSYGDNFIGACEIGGLAGWSSSFYQPSTPRPGLQTAPRATTLSLPLPR